MYFSLGGIFVDCKICHHFKFIHSDKYRKLKLICKLSLFHRRFLTFSYVIFTQNRELFSKSIPFLHCTALHYPTYNWLRKLCCSELDYGLFLLKPYIFAMDFLIAENKWIIYNILEVDFLFLLYVLIWDNPLQ